jgi:hypothetical protein
LAKTLAIFSKTNVMIKILDNLALFWVKNANFFAEFFGENIFKNHNIRFRAPLKNCPRTHVHKTGTFKAQPKLARLRKV